MTPNLPICPHIGDEGDSWSLSQETHFCGRAHPPTINISLLVTLKNRTRGGGPLAELTSTPPPLLAQAVCLLTAGEMRAYWDHTEGAPAAGVGAEDRGLMSTDSRNDYDGLSSASSTVEG